MKFLGVVYNINMTNFPNYTNIPEYKELREKQKKLGQVLNDEDRAPALFKNFLSQEELSYIQDRFKNYPKDKITIKNFDGVGTMGGEPGKEQIIKQAIFDRVAEAASVTYGEELEVIDFSQTVYSLDFGPIVQLPPHFDTKPIETLIFDIQVSSNHDWDLVIEGENYQLNDGDALLFASTTQCHWREQKEFNKNNRTSMIFISLQHKNKRKILDEHRAIKDERLKVLTKELKIDKEKIQNIIKTSQNKIARNPLTHAAKYNNIFTDKEIEQIYNSLDLQSDKNTDKVSIYGQKVWHTELPQEIIDKVTHQMYIVHNQNCKLEAMSFARYSKEYSDIPILTPHYDNAFKEPRLTLDVQLRSNISWDIYVEGIKLRLQDNEAATFSGTHQIHWRDPIEFKDNDFVEMLFCHFTLEDSKPITIDEKRDIESRMMKFSNEFSVKLMKKNIELKNLIQRYTYE